MRRASLIFLALCLFLAASAVAAPDKPLTADQQRIIDYIADSVIKTGALRFKADEILKATGVSKETLESLDDATIRRAVLAELARRHFKLAPAGSAPSGSAPTAEEEHPVRSLEEGGPSLREAFNAERSKVRMLLILSPT